MTDWRRLAACRWVDPELFFPNDEDDTGNHALDAKRVCVDCKSRMQCLDYAIRGNEQHGIWGGFGRDVRLHLARVRRTGNALAYHLALADETDALARQIHGWEDDREPTDPAPCRRCGSLVPAGRHPVDRNSGNARCGKPSTYNKGCRCTRCVEAKRVYVARQALRRRLAASPGNDVAVIWSIRLVSMVPLVPVRYDRPTHRPEEIPEMTDTADRVFEAPTPLTELHSLTGLKMTEEEFERMGLLEWGELGENLLHITEATNWWLGDWFDMGIEKFGEQEASQFWDERHDLRKYENCRWVARAFPEERRKHELIWSLHKLAAGIPDEEDRWSVMDWAAEHKPTYREFEAHVEPFKKKKTNTDDTDDDGRSDPSMMSFTLVLKIPADDYKAGEKILAQLENVAGSLMSDEKIIGRIEPHKPTAPLAD